MGLVLVQIGFLLRGFWNLQLVNANSVTLLVQKILLLTSGTFPTISKLQRECEIVGPAFETGWLVGWFWFSCQIEMFEFIEEEW